MQRCQRLQDLLLGPAPDQGPGLDLILDLTLEVALAQDPENAVIVRGLVPALALTLRPTETIPPETIRTTEGASEATTEATEGRTTTAAETEATTSAAITKTGEVEVVMAISLTGRAVEEAGMIARTTAPEGAALAPAHQESVQVAAAALATPIAPHPEDLDALSAPATPHGPALGHRVTVAVRARRAPKKAKKSSQKVKQRNLGR